MTWSAPTPLRAIFATWQRDERWNSPAYVDNHLAATRHAEHHARQTTELRRAEAAASSDPNEADRLLREAGHSDALADTLTGEVTRLEHDAEVRSEYLVHTAHDRAHALHARAILTERGVSLEPEHAVTAEEHLAADRAARVEDDPYRDITDTDLNENNEQRANQHSDERASSDRVRTGHADNPDDGADSQQARPIAPRPVDDELEGVADAAKPPPTDATSRAADDASREDHDHASEETAHDQSTVAKPDEPDLGERARGCIDEDTVHVPDPIELDAIREKTREAAIHLADRASLEAEHQEQERADQLARWHTTDHSGDHGHTHGADNDDPGHDVGADDPALSDAWADA